MNIVELRDLIADLPGDMPVILQKDAEGNGYSPLDAADEGMYSANSAWSGEGYHTPEQLAYLIANGTGGWTEDDAAPEDAIRVFILAPVN